ncbi:MAG: 8-amino-7-oxononanoate synthase [Candidatus Omnitrophica bacterium]|nr:8-amino-7-oxononanoate synthase [Candidatus Omnitrophota bacterium]
MNKSFDLFLTDELKKVEDRGIKRHLRTLQSPQGPKVMIDGKEYLNFCSNDYLGLANDKRLKDAAKECITKEGLGSGASRLVCGNLSAHVELEKSLAEFKGTESALVFNTGYMANVGIISALFDRQDMIFADKLNHASIVDGILLSQAKFKRYPHNDMGALEELLKTETGKKRVIITDSVFSMDGDLAPLDKIVELAKKYDCLVMIDEAHAFGIMGKNGKGLVEHFGVEKEIDIQMGTLSKAVGSFGAYVCGSSKLKTFLVNKARSFIYTTALPPSVAAASKMGIDIIRQDLALRQKLWDNTKMLHQELKRLGFNIMNTETPITPIFVGDAVEAIHFSKKLFEAGILISAIRPPTVPQNTSRLRLTVTAGHAKEDMMQLLSVLERIGKELCLIG